MIKYLHNNSEENIYSVLISMGLVDDLRNPIEGIDLYRIGSLVIRQIDDPNKLDYHHGVHIRLTTSIELSSEQLEQLEEIEVSYVDVSRVINPLE